MSGSSPTDPNQTHQTRGLPPQLRLGVAAAAVLLASQLCARFIDSPQALALTTALIALLPLFALYWQRSPSPVAANGLGLYGRSFLCSGAPLILVDSDGLVININYACQRLLGLERTEYNGRPIGELVPPEWLPHFSPRQPDKEGSPYWSDQVSLTGSQDTSLTILLQSHLIADSDEPQAIMTACIDLTAPMEARRQQEELTARGKAYIQHLVNVIPQPVYIRDAQSRYLIVNEAFAAIYARTPEQIRGLSPWDLVSDPAHAEESTQEDQEVLSGRNIFKEVVRPYGVSREERCLVVSKGCCRNPEDQPVIVGAHFDVTKWRFAERQLQEALAREVGRRESYQAYVQRLIDVIPHPVYVKDRHSRCLLANEAYARLLAQNRDALPGQSSVLAVDAETAAIILKEDAEVLAGATVLKEESTRCFPADQGKRFRVITKGRCTDAEGEPVIVCAMFDVTEWRLAEARWIAAKEEAERANDAKTVFLANMSHELRTPMHAVLSFARLGLTRTEHNSHLQKEHGYFERIVRSGERLLGLLNDLLDLAKLEEGRQTAVRVRFSMQAVIHDVLGEFAALMDSKQIALDLQLGETPSAIGDPALMGQLVRNLLSNAIKFSPSGAAIGLCLAVSWLDPHDGAVPRLAIEIRVADNGVGIPEPELETIFDKFVQSSKTHSGAGGTGLGLSICREIVRQHKGEIFARNRSSGGAEFIARIPAADGA